MFSPRQSVLCVLFAPIFLSLSLSLLFQLRHFSDSSFLQIKSVTARIVTANQACRVTTS